MGMSVLHREMCLSFFSAPLKHAGRQGTPQTAPADTIHRQYMLVSYEQGRKGPV